MGSFYEMLRNLNNSTRIGSLNKTDLVDRLESIRMMLAIADASRITGEASVSSLSDAVRRAESGVIDLINDARR